MSQPPALRLKPLWPTTLVTILLAALGSPANAQKNQRARQDEKRENQRVDQAQEHLKESQLKLSQAREALKTEFRQMQKLESDADRASDQLRNTREKTEERLAKDLGIELALAHLEKTKTELATISKPLIEKERKTHAWKSANQLAAKATTERRTLWDDAELEPAIRAVQLKELAVVINRPSEIEQAAILADSEGKRLSHELKTAYASVQKIRQSVSKDKVDADPQVAKAQQTLERIQRDLQSQQKSLANVRSTVLRASQQANLAQQKLNEARRADAQDANQPNRNRK